MMIMQVSIKGVLKTSMLDYPGRISAVMFLPFCNLRCPFCHNPELITNPDELDDIDPEDFIDFLKRRKNWLDGVVITGGEPTMHKGLPELISRIKKLGYLVKLDSNGTNPEMLKELLDRKLLDYIAMDFKSSLERYDEVTAVKVDKEKIKKSVELIKQSGIDHEFRATVLPDFFDTEEAKKISEWLKGAKRFALQQFKNVDKVLDPSFQDKESYTPDELTAFKRIMEPYFDEVEVRGI
ncbi:anaerobic ribonucleoside-triphosphate reductase activating protein [Candidatus Woesearchaeota archaeon]|nr:anaerobic ribonucleoside-triphosphate reductase activating protein [Candidatus Woesearchaeota archaeon]